MAKKLLISGYRWDADNYHYASAFRQGICNSSLGWPITVRTMFLLCCQCWHFQSVAAEKTQKSDNTHHNRKSESLRTFAISYIHHSHDSKHITDSFMVASRQDLRVRVAIIMWMCNCQQQLQFSGMLASYLYCAANFTL